MDISTAKRILEPLVRSNNKIIPTLTNDWVIYTNRSWSGTSSVHLKSEY